MYKFEVEGGGRRAGASEMIDEVKDWRALGGAVRPDMVVKVAGGWRSAGDYAAQEPS